MKTLTLLSLAGLWFAGCASTPPPRSSAADSTSPAGLASDVPLQHFSGSTDVRLTGGSRGGSLSRFGVKGSQGNGAHRRSA